MQMDEELKNLEKFSKRVSWLSVVLAFLSGSVGFLKFSELYSQYAIAGSIFLAFISGFLGLTVKFIQNRQEELQVVFKKTKPKMDVSIKRGIEDGNLYVVIEPSNRVPFDFSFLVVTKNNQVVSGILLERPKIYPDINLKKFLYCVHIEMQKVIDDYIELRFDFRSIYSPEFSKEDLQGSIVKKLRASDLYEYQ